MDTTTTITLESGQEIVLRRPTEAQALALTDKREDAKDPALAGQDFLDDGDEEVLACVVSPDRAAMEGLLEDFPHLAKTLERALRVLGGDPQPLTEEAGLITDALREKHGARLIGLRVGGPEGTPVIVKRMGRFALKEMERSLGKIRRFPSYSALADLAKASVVDPVPAWEDMPFLSQNLGAYLYMAGAAKVQAAAGKSLATSGK